MIFVVKTKEGSGVQAEDQDDSDSTQPATWDPGFWEQLENTGTPPPGGGSQSLGALSFYRPPTGGVEQMFPNLGGGREAPSQPLSTH